MKDNKFYQHIREQKHTQKKLVDRVISKILLRFVSVPFYFFFVWNDNKKTKKERKKKKIGK